MAVRIQFRRGTAAEWTSANPTLAPGELGYETDTAKFKIGDGTTAWTSLNYGGINQADIDNAVANVIDLAPSTLDTLNEIAASLGDDPDFINTVGTAIATAESNVRAYADGQANSAQANAQAYADNAVANLVSSAPGALDTLNELAAALGDDPNFSTTITNSLANRIEFVTDTAANFASANAVLDAQTFGITSDTRRVKVGDGVQAWGDLTWLGEDFVLEHNSATTVHGITNTLELVYQADLTPYAELESATMANTTFTGDITLPSTTDIGNVTAAAIGYLENVGSDIQEQLDAKLSSTLAANTYAPIANASFTGSVVLPSTTQIGDVSSTEIGYLQGVTSAIQTQFSNVDTDLSNLQAGLDNKIDSSDAANTYAPIANASFTGTVVLPTETSIGNVSSTEIATLDGIDTSLDLQSQLNSKAELNSPTFSGTVALPTDTSIGNVSATEIGHLEGLTSAIQTQLDGKLASSVAATTYAPLESPSFTGTVSLPADTSIGNVTATEISYLANTANEIQTQLNNKAPLSSPTFTGTVSGITASMVGLGNVDNTADLDKPVSTATQTALDAKLSLSGGTMTGKITLDGDPTQAMHAVTKQYVDSVEAGLITRPAVRAATTEPLPSAGTNVTYDNGTDGVGATLNLGQLASLTIDGISSWTQWDGILVKDQTNKFENGRYVVFQIGNDVDTDWILRRCSLCDTADEIPGSYIFVTDGTVNEQTGWVQHVDDPATFTVGTDDIDVYQFAGAGSVTAGTNISVSGKQVSVVDNPTFTSNVAVQGQLTLGIGGMGGGIEFSDGTIQYSAGVPSLTVFTEKTANYTLDTLTHQDNVIEMNSSSALTFTIPTDAALAWPVGASMDIFQMGTGQVTVVGDTGVTVLFTPGNKLRTQYSSCTIMKRAADSWVLYGDLTA